MSWLATDEALEVLREKLKMTETTAETTESQELRDFKAKLWHTVMDKKREHSWCGDAEALLTDRLGVQDPSPAPEDIFPYGTILAYEGTTYMAHKSFAAGGEAAWEYGGSGENNKAYDQDYAAFLAWVRDMSSRPRVLRYGTATGGRHVGSFFNERDNALEEQ